MLGYGRSASGVAAAWQDCDFDQRR